MRIRGEMRFELSHKYESGELVCAGMANLLKFEAFPCRKSLMGHKPERPGPQSSVQQRPNQPAPSEMNDPVRTR